MKFPATFLALVSVSSATLLISNLAGPNVTIGKTYEFDYVFDKKYTAELWLVEKGTQPNIAWTQVKNLFSNKKIKPCSGKYVATPDSSWPVSTNGSEYALWISGMESGGKTGYAALTKYFSIYDAES